MKKSWSLGFVFFFFLLGCWLSLYTFESDHKQLGPIPSFTQVDPNNSCIFKLLIFKGVLFLKGELFEYTFRSQNRSKKFQCKVYFHSSGMWVWCMDIYSCSNYCTYRNVIPDRKFCGIAKKLHWNGTVFLTWPCLSPLHTPPTG